MLAPVPVPLDDTVTFVASQSTTLARAPAPTNCPESLPAVITQSVAEDLVNLTFLSEVKLPMRAPTLSPLASSLHNFPSTTALIT